MPFATIGDYSIDRVAELEFPAFDAREFFPAATAEMVAEARARLGEQYLTTDGRLVMSFQTFILRTGRHTILIDTCCGNDKSRPQRPEFDRIQTSYLADLTAAGVKPEDVDFVMCTHLHWDHVGWNTRLVDGSWVPTFPNARYVMARKEYDYWDGVYQRREDSPHRLAFEDSILPLRRAEQAMLVDDDFELEEGIWLEPFPGHSPGNAVINVESRGQRGVFAGDTIHHRMQLLFPTLCCRVDSDKVQSEANRRRLVDQHTDLGSLVMPAHFTAPHAGRLVVRDGAHWLEG